MFTLQGTNFFSFDTSLPMNHDCEQLSTGFIMYLTNPAQSLADLGHEQPFQLQVR